MNGRHKVWLCSAAALVVLVAYLPFLRTLVQVSTKHPYAGHVIFVPVFAAVLLWFERERFRSLAGSGSAAAGLGVTALALAAVAIGYQLASVPLQALSFVVAAAGFGLWCCGLRGLRAAAFVLVFLLLMVPPPREAVSAIAPTVQHALAAFTTLVLDCLRIPVARDGILLRLPELTLEVAEECAGLRFLLILFVFVAAFARAVLPTTAGQCLLIALSIPVAVLANATRVVVSSVGAHAIGPEAAAGPLHYYIGKSFWAAALLVMIGLAVLLRSRTGGLTADRRTFQRLGGERSVSEASG
jgi:exosortase